MKAVWVPLMFALVMSVSAQKAIVPKGNFQDSMQQRANDVNKEQAQSTMQNHLWCQQGNPHEFDMRKNWMEQNCGSRFGQMGNVHRGVFGMAPWMQQHRHFITHRFFFKILFLVFAIVNLLLTILISLDMARLGRFNGLWIPIILLMGVPGSIIYALFRLGDNLLTLNLKR
jgi:hypothetical protein